MVTYTPTPTHLHAPNQPTEVDLPSSIGDGPRYDFFRKNPPQLWLPEVYLAQGEASLEPFFETIKILMEARYPFNNLIRSFCHKLWKFYNVDGAGMRLKKLQESERSAQLEKKIYHVEADGNLYRCATEDDTSSQRKAVRSEKENEPDETTNTLNDLTSSTSLSPGDKPIQSDEVDISDEEITRAKATPFYDMILHVFRKTRGEDTPLPDFPTDILSLNHLEMAKYAYEDLDKSDKVSKDTLVLLSGIINTLSLAATDFTLSSVVKSESRLPWLSRKMLTVETLLLDLLSALCPGIEEDSYAEPNLQDLQRKVWGLLSQSANLPARGKEQMVNLFLA